MPDQPADDSSPSEPPEDAAPAPVGAEGELDSLLTAAADLASEVAAEIGEPETTPALSEKDAAFLETDEPLGDDLDAQLAELERLAEAAATEVGSSEADDATDNPPTDDSGGQVSEEASARLEPTSLGVNADAPQDDPLDDLTRPPVGDGLHSSTAGADEASLEATGESYDDDDLTSSPAGGAPTDAFGAPPTRNARLAAKANRAPPAANGEHKGIDGDEIRESSIRSEPGASATGLAATDPGEPDAVVAEQGAPQGGRSGGRATFALLRQGEKVLLPGAAGVVRLLERIDGPVSGISERLKTALGWAALATLGTAAMTLAWSLLR